MPELRIILLIAGVLFIAGIATFEWWRNRGARAYAAPTREESGSDPAPSQASPQTRAPLHEISAVREARTTQPETLPVIELDYSEMKWAEKRGAGTGMGQSMSNTTGIAVSGEVAVDMPMESTSTQAILRAHDQPPHDHYVGEDDEISAVRVIDEQPVVGPKLVLSWPKEGERRIVTLRVIPQREPRFAGRALRQAFASSGFWHGPLDIFHLPDAEGRVMLSAAALAQPGTFDPSIMDSQRFSGVNLFAVLPGPLGQRETFEELIHAARALAERLEGAITDQHGDELTPARIARLRQSLEGPPPEQAAGES